MYKKILVPLDGSQLAECVLPHVESFIKEFKASDVILLHVVEPERYSYGQFTIPPEMFLKGESETKSVAKDYLDKIVKRLKHEGAALHSEVIVGRVAETLANYAVENGIDLILMGTHGHSGVMRWVKGSVTDKIFRSAEVPVLIVRAPGAKGGI
jgi:nucleotide-binding universal stress UspA family protein